MRFLGWLALGVFLGLGRLAAEEPNYGTDLPLVPKAQYEFRFLKKQSREKHYPQALFEFTWKGPGEVSVSGYTFNKDESFPVVASVSFKKEKGWEKMGLGFCGVGLSTLSFKPDTRYVLDLQLSIFEGPNHDENQGATKGVVILTVKEGTGPERQLVSEEFDLPLKDAAK